MTTLCDGILSSTLTLNRIAIDDSLKIQTSVRVLCFLVFLWIWTSDSILVAVSSFIRSVSYEQASRLILWADMFGGIRSHFAAQQWSNYGLETSIWVLRTLFGCQDGVVNNTQCDLVRVVTVTTKKWFWIHLRHFSPKTPTLSCYRLFLSATYKLQSHFSDRRRFTPHSTR